MSYVAFIKAAGFVDVDVVDKAASDIPTDASGPRIFSARVTARKP